MTTKREDILAKAVETACEHLANFFDRVKHESTGYVLEALKVLEQACEDAMIAERETAGGKLPQPLREFIAEQKKVITDDARYAYPPANVVVNAPLALIQVAMKARMQTLEQVEARIQ